MESARLNKIAERYRRILVHKNSREELGLGKVTTSDLRFTKGVDEKCADPDLVVYMINAYEPTEIVKETINKYIENSDMVLIGEKKSTKAITKLLEVDKKFYEENNLICHVPKQARLENEIDEREIETELNGTKLRFKTQEGLFAYKGIDPGTRFLLESVKIEGGKILDFGCGYGVIGIYCVKKGCEAVMVDSNLRAVEYAKKNAKLNKVDVEIKPSYLLTEVKGKFDKILSNPPTHTKLEEIEELIKGFKRVLKKGGEAYLVVNKIVDYERIAEKVFDEAKIIAEKGKYKIIKIDQTDSST